MFDRAHTTLVVMSTLSEVRERALRAAAPFVAICALTGCDSLLGPSLPSEARLRFTAPARHVVASEPFRLLVGVVDAERAHLRHTGGEVYLRLQEHASGALLVGTTKARIVEGFAVFNDVTVDRPATNLRLEASFEQEASFVTSTSFASVEAPDLIRIGRDSGEATAGEAGFIVDGLGAAGFINDLEIVSDAPRAEVILERAQESNDVLVFREGRAPGLVSAPWTSRVDTVDVTLTDPLDLPITVWAIAGGDGFEDLRAMIEEGFRRAQAIFDRERAGVDITSGLEIVDATESPHAEAYATYTSPFGNGNVREDIGHRENRINAWAVEAIVLDGRSVLGFANAPTSEFAISASEGGWNGRTVAHELGHVFGLPHTGAIEGWEDHASNLMGGLGTALTEGQVFRMHFSTGSAIYRTYGIRTDQARRCRGTMVTREDPECVPWNLRLWPDEG